MKFIKYTTGKNFANKKFSEMLNYQLNVKARAYEDGVVLDVDAFNAIPVETLTDWALINKEYINSKQYTKPASYKDYARYNDNHNYTLLLIKSETTEPLRMLSADNPKDFTTAIDIMRKSGTVIVVDNKTGEVVKEYV